MSIQSSGAALHIRFQKKKGCRLPCWRTLTEHPLEVLPLSGREASTSLCCRSCRLVPCKSAAWRGHQRTETMQPWKRWTDLCGQRHGTLCKVKHSGAQLMEDLPKSRHILRCWSYTAEPRNLQTNVEPRVDHCKTQKHDSHLHHFLKPTSVFSRHQTDTDLLTSWHSLFSVKEDQEKRSDGGLSSYLMSLLQND